MTRAYAPAALVLALLHSTGAPAQQPLITVGSAPTIVGPSGAGLQPQINTSPYPQLTTAPAARGVNPFARSPLAPAFLPGARFAPRAGAPPVAFAPPPAAGGGVANNPAMLNRGALVAFPVAIPPLGGAGVVPANGFAFNPVFVTRPGATSAYYFPPLAPRQPGEPTPTLGEGRSLPSLGPVLYPVVAATGDPAPATPTLAADPAATLTDAVLSLGDLRLFPWVR